MKSTGHGAVLSAARVRAVAKYNLSSTIMAQDAVLPGCTSLQGQRDPHQTEARLGVRFAAL